MIQTFIGNVLFGMAFGLGWALVNGLIGLLMGVLGQARTPQKGS